MLGMAKPCIPKVKGALWAQSVQEHQLEACDVHGGLAVQIHVDSLLELAGLVGQAPIGVVWVNVVVQAWGAHRANQRTLLCGQNPRL